MKVLLLSLGVAALVFGAIALGIALGGLVIWFFGNIILGYMGKELMPYSVAFAISAILWFIGTLFKPTSNK